MTKFSPMNYILRSSHLYSKNEWSFRRKTTTANRTREDTWFFCCKTGASRTSHPPSHLYIWLPGVPISLHLPLLYSSSDPFVCYAPVPRDDDSDSSDSDDNTLMLATLLTLSIDASGYRRRQSAIPRRVIASWLIVPRWDGLDEFCLVGVRLVWRWALGHTSEVMFKWLVLS
jgi:hypothetical protein